MKFRDDKQKAGDEYARIWYQKRSQVRSKIIEFLDDSDFSPADPCNDIKRFNDIILMPAIKKSLESEVGFELTTLNKILFHRWFLWIHFYPMLIRGRFEGFVFDISINI